MMHPSEAPSCPSPVLQPRLARTLAPPGACDCHFHIFGPYDHFPLSATRTYTPPQALVPAFRRVQAALRFDRSVIVQPSVYGTDNACLLDAVRQLGGPEQCRAVVVVGPDIEPKVLRQWHEAGVRGVRLNAVSGGGPSPGDLAAVASLVAPLGWHVQLYLSQDGLADAAPLLQTLPVDVVIDHFGGLDPGRGEQDPSFRTLLRLVEAGRTWVKLSGGYLSSTETAPWADIAPFARALAAVRPDRVVWGSNWPHPIRFREMPDDGDLLDALAEWLPDPLVLQQVLVDNPTRLYDFSAPSRC